MKEPKNHRPFEVEEAPLYVDYCAADGDEWPCKTWQKWTASPTYRLGEIEAKFAANEKRAATAREELREAKEKLRRLELLVRGGVMLYLRDSGANITEAVNIDYHEHNMASGHVFRSVNVQEYTVEYTSKNARYVNGRMEESWS